MVPTGLIAAVKPNTLKSTQRALRELRFTSVEPTKTVITKQKMMSVKTQEYRLVSQCADSIDKVGVWFNCHYQTGGFTTLTVINPLDSKLANRTFVRWVPSNI